MARQRIWLAGPLAQTLKAFMAKPDAALLDPARYPFSCEVPTRFADLDPNGHVNNVALAAIVEDARVRFHLASGFAKGMEPGGQVMLASFSIDYLAQTYYPAPITVWQGVVKAGERSLRLRHLLVQEGRAVALAESVAVYVLGGKAAPLPLGLLARVEELSCR